MLVWINLGILVMTPVLSLYVIMVPVNLTTYFNSVNDFGYVIKSLCARIVVIKNLVHIRFQTG